MIQKQELLDLATDFGLQPNVVEKDYALGCPRCLRKNRSSTVFTTFCGNWLTRGRFKTRAVDAGPNGFLVAPWLILCYQRKPSFNQSGCSGFFLSY